MRGARRAIRLRTMSARRFASVLLALCCVVYIVISFGFYDDAGRTNVAKSQPCLTAHPTDLRHHALEDGQPECSGSLCERVPTRELQSTFRVGTWKSRFATPGYHKHYSVNCSGIIHNNQTIIRNAYELIREEHNRHDVILPCDDTVTDWTKDCELYKKHRRYPVKALSEEEDDYPIAYIITGHKDAAQMERLLRAIFHPQNFYCIHIDAKSEPGFHKAIRNLAGCFDNVFVASKLENIQYAGFSRVIADLNCMNDLVQYKWKYVINLCGQDFPLKTNLEIVKQMKAYRGFNDIPGIYPEQTEWFVGRTKFKHQAVNGEIIRTDIEKPPPPHNAKMYFGNAYYAASKQYVEYILNNNIAKDILTYLSDSLSPDEHYWVTINRYPGVPGGYQNSSWNSNVRFIRWTNADYYAPCVGKYIRAVCVIGAGYLPYLSRQPQIFVNKIHYDYDPITLQCLEEFLDYRTVFPGALSEYIQDFPLTNLFP